MRRSEVARDSQGRPLSPLGLPTYRDAADSRPGPSLAILREVAFEAATDTAVLLGMRDGQYVVAFQAPGDPEPRIVFEIPAGNEWALDRYVEAFETVGPARSFN